MQDKITSDNKPLAQPVHEQDLEATLTATYWILLWLMLVISGIASGCTHVCARSWEMGATVEHSALWGQSYGSQVSVGGGLGRVQCADQK